MENASKALVIAGAILVSILLITIGVLVINAINPMTDAARKRSETMAVETFNGQFTSYLGDNLNAAQVRSLITAVGASNANNKDHPVGIYFGSVGDSNDLTKSTSQITSTGTYKVSSTQADGYITTLIVTK